MEFCLFLQAYIAWLNCLEVIVTLLIAVSSKMLGLLKYFLIFFKNVKLKPKLSFRCKQFMGLFYTLLFDPEYLIWIYLLVKKDNRM